MKVIEFIEFVGNGKNKMLKGVQLEELISKKLEVKKYVGIKDKKKLVESIVNECILYDNGMFKFDEIDKYICFTMRVIEAYTNLELSTDIEADYDALCEAGLLEIVINTFKKEYDDVNVLLQMKCEYVLSDNNLTVQVCRFLGNISEKLDVFSASLSQKIDGVDFSKLPISTDGLNKLLEFINKNK